MHIQCTFKVYAGSMFKLDPDDVVVWVVLAGGGWRYKGGGRITAAGVRTVLVG